MSLAPTLSELLCRPLPQARSLELRYLVVRRFRPVFLLELMAGSIALLCLLPLFIVAFVLALMEGDLDFDLPSFRRGPGPGRGPGPQHGPRIGAGDSEHRVGLFASRVYEHSLCVRITVSGPEGAVISQVDEHPRGREEVDALRAGLMATAARQGLLLREIDQTDGDAARQLALWPGGRPLLSPTLPPPQQLAEDLPPGLSARRHERAWVVLQEPDPNIGGRWAAFFKATLIALIAPLMWISGDPPGRSFKQHAAHALGLPPRLGALEVRADGVRYTERRGELTLLDLHLPGEELIAVSSAEQLDCDRRVTLHGPQLALIGRHRTRRLPIEFTGEEPERLAAFLRSATLALRETFPEGSIRSGDRETRCPYCEHSQVFVPGRRCERCGGWPDALS